MKIILKSLILLLALGFSTDVEAQFLKRLKKAVQSGAEDAVIKKSEEKAEDETEKMMDEILNNEEEEKKRKEREASEEGDSINNDGDDIEDLERQKAMMELLGGGKVETKENYSFNVIATMETQSFDGKEEKHILKQGYGTNCIFTSVDQMETPMIHDFDNEAMIVLNEKKKEAQVMSLGWMAKMGGQDVSYANEGGVDIKKTGNTKTILNYLCEEYIITHEDGRMEAWFAPKVDFSFNDYWNGFAKFFKSTVDPTMLEKNGYTMEMTMYDEKGDKSGHMKVVDINMEGMKVNLKDYKVSNMFGG